ncbi:MAG: enoyl-CoA hydratase/isomerase family protein [Actinomycetia bacterium]|nr:enoyl-CoA hydratase/isomerase family protein [Actinomycetes bacterium]MCP4223581.1 enoyl-CoA hydratase/isomerase family protein [Actinomycetes bacterium]MCP5035196.1 enoyl-CoA hydratase/isomerase family protein [Actinomycetes bacterium]
MNDPVDLELDGPLAIVSLNNPPLNIFNLAMRDELIQAFQAVNDIPDVRAMVLRAEGKHFSAGADLSEFGTAESVFEGRRIRWDRDPWGLLVDLRVPTIAAIRGTALGSGLEMSLLCDLRLADTGSTIGLPETKLAMLPAAGGTQSLTRAIGPHQALPPIALASSMSATEALARGIVHEVVDDVDHSARHHGEQLALVHPEVLRAGRRALRAAGDLDLDRGLRYEKSLATTLGSIMNRAEID